MKKCKKLISLILCLTLILGTVIAGGAIKASALGNTRYSVLVLDVSGSMSGSRLDSVKVASKKFVDYVLSNPNGDKNYIAIVTFETDSKVVSDFTNNKNSLYSAIDSLVALDMTNLAAGINSAAELLNKVSSNAIKNMFIMCDGYPNEGSPNGETAAYNAVAALPQEWNVIGMYFSGGNTDPSALEVMQKVGRNGCYGPIVDGSEVEYIFAEVWSEEATTREVNNIRIRIACPVDVSVDLNGVILDRDNPKTLFGSIEFQGSGDDEVKIVTLTYRDDYVIKVVGTGTGTMDYSISYRCNDEEIYRLTYPTIDVTPQTIVTGKVNFDDKKIKLDVDDNGDGVVDKSVSGTVSESGGILETILGFLLMPFITIWGIITTFFVLVFGGIGSVFSGISNLFA